MTDADDADVTTKNLTNWERNWLDSTDHELDDELSTPQACETGLFFQKEDAVNKGRSTGLLGGVEAPEFFKYGKTIRYSPRQIFAWRRRTVTVQTRTTAAA